MGRRDKEKIEQLNQGLGQRFRNTAIKIATRGAVIDELRKGTTSDQVSRLDELVGHDVLPPGKLKQAIMKKAPREMDKAISKFQKEGKPITVTVLCKEVQSEPGFLSLCERIGLSLEWFQDLADSRMKAKGI